MLIDNFERVVDYLRISVTQRCNFRCQYCMPEKPFSWLKKEHILSFEEMFTFVKLSIDQGIKKIRITGGEPLLRNELYKFIKMIYNYSPNIDLSITSNAFLLKSQAKQLKDAGLQRINISLDTLKPEVAEFIAQKNVLLQVLDGIDEALKVGLKVKINMIPMQGINDTEILDILKFCKYKHMPIRFIEYMKNEYANKDIVGIKSDKLLSIIGEKYHFTDNGFRSSSPSHNYRMDDGYEFGIIEPYKDDFCTKCNRIRVTSDGDIIPCLYYDEAMNIKEAIKQNDNKKILNILKEVVKNKPEKNRWGENGNDEISVRKFYETGG